MRAGLENVVLRVSGLDGLELLYGSYDGTQRFPRHYHEEYVLSVMVRGAERLQHRGTSHVVPTGNVILLNPGEWHENSGWEKSHFAFRSLYAPVALVQRMSCAMHGQERLPSLGQTVVDDETLRGLLLRFHAACEQRASLLELESHLMEMVAHLFASPTEGSAPSVAARPEHRGMTQIREYLEAHYTDNISLADLSERAGISPYHLLRTFRDTVGVPPHEYQTHTRIGQAKRLLRAGVPLAATAATVGFADQSHLTRLFKRIVGVTPGQFAPNRKNVQEMADGGRIR